MFFKFIDPIGGIHVWGETQEVSTTYRVSQISNLDNSNSEPYATLTYHSGHCKGMNGL